MVLSFKPPFLSVSTYLQIRPNFSIPPFIVFSLLQFVSIVHRKVVESFKRHRLKVCEEEDPKAVLDGVAVAGLVGILRQLGDIADGYGVVAIKPHFIERTGIANLFVKNLDSMVTNAKLAEVFGRILSCKIAKDDHGKSKGFGFVQFDSEESANNAIESIDGTTLDEKIIL